MSGLTELNQEWRREARSTIIPDARVARRRNCEVAEEAFDRAGDEAVGFHRKDNQPVEILIEIVVLDAARIRHRVERDRQPSQDL